MMPAMQHCFTLTLITFLSLVHRSVNTAELVISLSRDVFVKHVLQCGKASVQLCACVSVCLCVCAHVNLIALSY